MADTKIEIEAYCFPMMVSEYPDTDDSSEQIMEGWRKFDSLSKNKKDILISENTGTMIKRIKRLFLLSEDSTREISRIVRDLFFGKISENSLAQEITKRVTELENNPEQAAKIISEKIFNAENQEQALDDLARFSFSEALKKYPEINEQLITGEKITLKNFPEPVRPSIKNWLMDYTYSLGYGQHNSIERGNFIFQNQNCKHLNFSERENLSFILKANDENSAVEVNIRTKQIVFPKKEIQKRAAVFAPKTIPSKTSLTEKNVYTPKTFPQNPDSFSKPNENFSFSSPQKMPSEKEKSPKPLVITAKSIKNSSANIPQENIVDLKKMIANAKKQN